MCAPKTARRWETPRGSARRAVPRTRRSCSRQTESRHSFVVYTILPAASSPWLAQSAAVPSPSPSPHHTTRTASGEGAPRMHLPESERQQEQRREGDTGGSQRHGAAAGAPTPARCAHAQGGPSPAAHAAKRRWRGAQRGRGAAGRQKGCAHFGMHVFGGRVPLRRHTRRGRAGRCPLPWHRAFARPYSLRCAAPGCAGGGGGGPSPARHAACVRTSAPSRQRA